jgi:apolipoprotein N-acyltransferase
VVQPSVPQDGKWDPAFRDSIATRLLELSGRPPTNGAARPELIVWPETALPYLLTDRPDALAAIGEMLQTGQRLLLGAVRSEGTAEASGVARYYNSVIAINDAGEIADAVDKVRLVPFGEFLPFQDLAEQVGLRTIAETIGGFSAGTVRHALVAAEGIRALPMICYEIIFPGEADAAIGGAELIVNVTNDGWFGDTPGPYQHFRQAQVRAVEAGMPLVRAANNGISAVVDEKGRIIDAFAIDAVGIIDATVRIPSERPRSIGGPLLNSFLILLFFATIACGMKVLQRIRSR